ncbi:cob(I)yrinic acid a,c-diamide adenosyltransferase [Candidatus Uhrbacteria bacterium]|nr:cob(I)yrinic acid a,c-diamide adenosyltransferase [Candidatus Uhrbacteria bacterium]
MIHLYTGNGKGKTTAALGLAMRAIGDGKKVFMIQFIKGPWPSGEDKSHKVFGERFVLVKGGKGFVGILNDTLPRSEHEQAARKTLERAEIEIETGEWDIVILDEVNVACDLNLIASQDVIDVVGRFSQRHPESAKAGEGSRRDSSAGPQNDGKQKPELIILTGRNAPKEFYEIADLVTEMQEVKHYYNEGQIAKRGVEF